MLRVYRFDETQRIRSTMKSAFPGGEKAVYRGTVCTLYQLDDVSRADEAVNIILNSLTIIGIRAGKDIG